MRLFGFICVRENVWDELDGDSFAHFTSGVGLEITSADHRVSAKRRRAARLR